MKHYQNPQILTPGQVICLTLIITMILFLTGLFTVNYVSMLEPWLQNIVYAIGRVPIIFVLLYAALVKEQQ